MPLRKDYLRWALLLGVVACSSGLWFYNNMNQQAHDASELLRIVQNVVPGSTTQAEVMELVKPYDRYLFRPDERDYVDGYHVITFRLLNFRSKTAIGMSVIFAGGRAVGRGVGMFREACCDVSMDQDPRIGFDDSSFGTARAFQSNVGNPNYLRFYVPSNLSRAEVHQVFAFQTKCLRPLSRCNSIDELNPSASKLLRASEAAGY